MTNLTQFETRRKKFNKALLEQSSNLPAPPFKLPNYQSFKGVIYGFSNFITFFS